uniref:Uncharacterized protein n=1 Tax=Physcomitrium patens TaxID=3218 RepID=A0A2K1L7A4_PHYPA|nr:hypothetical protein PHYPA_000343 [Physcomitrium patens]
MILFQIFSIVSITTGVIGHVSYYINNIMLCTSSLKFHLLCFNHIEMFKYFVKNMKTSHLDFIFKCFDVHFQRLLIKQGKYMFKSALWLIIA